LTQYTKTGKNIPNSRKLNKCPPKMQNWPKKFQLAIIYTNLFHSKALQNLFKVGFPVWKFTILQPWPQPLLTITQLSLITIKLVRQPGVIITKLPLIKILLAWKPPTSQAYLGDGEPHDLAVERHRVVQVARVAGRGHVAAGVDFVIQFRTEFTLKN
jgi:hypothetical protein